MAEIPTNLQGLFDSPDERSRLMHANVFRQSFGLSEFQFDDETKPPPLNADLIRALANGELDEDIANDLYRLVDRFRSWNHAFCQAILARMEEVKRNQG